MRYLIGIKNVGKWQVQLYRYGIHFVPHISVKGKAIADHLVEFPIDNEHLIKFKFSNLDDEGIAKESWKMYFDGSVNLISGGIRAVLISPKGKNFTVAAKVTFHNTNNITEYEACALYMRIALDF